MATEEVKKEEKNTEKPKEEAKAKKRYFRNAKVSALKVRRPTKDGSREVVAFTPFYEKYRGERVKVGYLEVDAKDPVVKSLEANGGCEEIKEKEYVEATKGEKSLQAPQ